MKNGPLGDVLQNMTDGPGGKNRVFGLGSIEKTFRGGLAVFAKPSSHVLADDLQARQVERANRLPQRPRLEVANVDSLGPRDRCDRVENDARQDENRNGANAQGTRACSKEGDDPRHHRNREQHGEGDRKRVHETKLNGGGQGERGGPTEEDILRSASRAPFGQ